MTINPISGQAPMTMSGASPMSGGRFDGQWQSAMSGAGSLLGIAPNQLESATKGTSLISLATSKGVSQESLLDTIKQSMQDAGSKLTGNRLDNIAARIARQHHQGGSWAAQ